MGRLLEIFGFKVLKTIGFVLVGSLLTTLGFAACVLSIQHMLNGGGSGGGGGGGGGGTGVAGVPELDPALLSTVAMLLGGVTLLFRDRSHKS